MSRAMPEMSNAKTWNTKYGPRRVKQAPPTLQEAIFAAKGLTDDVKEQIEIAASLIGLPPEDVRAEVMKSRRMTVQQVRLNSRDPGSARSVVVERRVVRRQATAGRLSS